MANEYEEQRPGEERPRRAGGPAPGSNNSACIIISSIGCLLCLGCVGLVAFAGYFGFKAFTTDMPAAQAVANQFLDLIQQNKIDEAYALTSPAFRTRLNPEQFGEFLKQFETFTKHTSRSQNAVRIFEDGRGKRVYLQLTLHAPNNAMTCTLEMVAEAETWKVNSITVP